MLIHFCLDKSSVFDCEVEIKNSTEMLKFTLSPFTTPEFPDMSSISINIEESEFNIILTPLIPPRNNNYTQNIKLKDKLMKKVENKLEDLSNKMFYRVSCKYRLTGIEDNSVININYTEYTLGIKTPVWLDIDFMPIIYSHFGIYKDGAPFIPEETKGLNRDEIIKFTKWFALFGELTLIMYPIQIFRTKRLTKDKNIFNHLIKFYLLTEEERQKLLIKMQSYFDL